MFRVGLRELERARTLRVRGAIPENDPLWRDVDLVFRTPVEVDLEVQLTPSGQVVARGRVETVMAQACRRCLEQVDQPFEESLAIVWALPDPLAGEEVEDGGELRVLEPGQAELDLGEAIREEILLSAPMYVVCREECRGICPVCGVNRNEEECHCAPVEPDPRWDALRRKIEEG